MLAALEVRGPDGIAVHHDVLGQVALGFRLLRTSREEPEPRVLSNEDGSLRMVCDGRVFNRRALSDWLLARGHNLRGDDSCEALLHLYEEEGPDGWRRADAQFALGLWDRGKGRLFLARDFLGVRPLYYCVDRHGVIFASEIKALLRHSRVPRAVDEVGVSHFLTFLNVPAPRTLF